MTTNTAERRRGAALEAALLTAAWEELATVGYARFTFEGVAARAGTSRAVLYRRWSSRQDLALAGIKEQVAHTFVEIPDMGNLRDELIALLEGFAERRTEVAVLALQQMGEFFAETGTALRDVRQFLMAGRRSMLDEILDRAVKRGEVDARRLTPRVRSVPGDLLRHELMMTFKPVPPKVIVEIVDEVFLPLVLVKG